MIIIDYDKSGTQITDDDVNRWSEAADNLDFSEFEDVSDWVDDNLSKDNEREEGM